MWLLTFIHHCDGSTDTGGGRDRVESYVFVDKAQAEEAAANCQDYHKYSVSDVRLQMVMIQPPWERFREKSKDGSLLLLDNTPKSCVLSYERGTAYYCQTHQHRTECEMVPPFCEIGAAEKRKKYIVGQLI